MIKFDIDKALSGLDKISDQTNWSLKVLGEVAAKRMEEYAKDNANWTDRTGHARKSITGYCDQKGNITAVGLSGGMEYSPYLELAMGKKYAVLYPTILEYEQEIIKAFADFLK